MEFSNVSCQYLITFSFKSGCLARASFHVVNNCEFHHSLWHADSARRVTIEHKYPALSHHPQTTFRRLISLAICSTIWLDPAHSDRVQFVDKHASPPLFPISPADMADYYPSHSTYDPQAFSGHSISYTGDPTEDNGIRRTATHGSYQSHHTQSHASISPSTRSWVYSNQINPPPPPLEPGPSVGHTPFHGPRPLPEPNGHHMTQMRPTFHDVPEEEEDEVGYMLPPPDGTQMLGGFHYAYQTQPGVPAGYAYAGPLSLQSAQSSPVPPSQFPRQNNSFVGGFFKGLKRIPKIFRGGRDKRQLSPLGLESNTDLTGITPGNTLPRYLSNPSIGPTNPQFAHRLSQAVANGTLPADTTPAAFQLRPALVAPQQPMVTLTPPSDGAEEEQQAEYFEGPDPLNNPSQMVMSESSEHHPANPTERATVMVYNRDSEAPTVTQTRRTPSGPRVSYAAELPTRASTQARMESFAPSQMAGPSTAQMSSPLRSLHRANPSSFVSSRQTPKGIMSPSTSGYTVTTATSYYDPSFSSNLSPVEKFFKSLYNLPWISQGRVTVDYRPADSPRAKGKLKNLKRPLSSWYHSMIARSRRNSIDLMSSNTASTGRDSNMLSSLASPTSQRSGRSGSHRHRTTRSRQHHRSRRRQTTSTSTAGVDTTTHRSASPIIPTMYPYALPPYSPYAYPYMPYTGAAPASTATPATPPRSPTSQRSPRATRSHRRTGKGSVSAAKYPYGGYTPFQPLVVPQSSTMPPTPGMAGMPAGGVYFITPSPPQSQNGEGAAAATGQVAGAAPMQFSPVIMHYVPAGLRADGVPGMVASGNHVAGNMMVSPPATPQKPTTTGSQNSHHSRHAQQA